MLHLQSNSLPLAYCHTIGAILKRDWILPVLAQVALFYTTGVCLPWISLLFGATVLGLVQIQRLGSHPSLIRIVQPALTVVAVAATLLKLLLMRAQQGQAPQVLALDADEASSIYLSGARQSSEGWHSWSLAGWGVQMGWPFLRSCMPQVPAIYILPATAPGMQTM